MTCPSPERPTDYNRRCNELDTAHLRPSYSSDCNRTASGTMRVLLASGSRRMRWAGYQCCYRQSSALMVCIPSCSFRKHSTSWKRNIRGNIPSNGVGIQIGQFAELNCRYRPSDIEAFGGLVGDMNPVHFPTNGTKNAQLHESHPAFDEPIVHGILVSSVFSTIFGTLIPGESILSYNQAYMHHDPPFVGIVFFA